MNDLLQTVNELRQMSSTELAQVGEDSLISRLKEQAAEARAKHGPLSPGNLETVLSDRDCVRYPTRLVLEYGEMGLHQFAQPDRDYRFSETNSRVLYLRPALGRRPDLLALALSYMIPLINYGQIITDEHCLAYGSILQGMDEETYYQKICEMADFAGAEERSAGETEESDSAVSPSSGGCGGGCGCSG